MRFIRKSKERAKRLKNEIIAISLAFKDKRTPLLAKIMIMLTVSYAVSPIDLVPDFIPVLGFLDDLVILPLMITISIKLIPDYIMTKCRNRVKEDYQINKRIGLPSTILIILIWHGLLGLIGLIIYKVFYWNF